MTAEAYYHAAMHGLYRMTKRRLGENGTPEQIRWLFSKEVERIGLAVPPLRLQLVAEEA